MSKEYDMRERPTISHAMDLVYRLRSDDTIHVSTATYRDLIKRLISTRRPELVDKIQFIVDNEMM